MPDMTPSVLANAIMAKLYNVLTNGDETVPKSDDNFFTWCTPGVPVDVADFDFLTQGLTGVVKPEASANLVTAGGAAGAGGTAAATATQPQITAAVLDQLRAQDTSRLYMQAESFARFVDFIPDVSRVNNDQFARFNIQNNEGTLSQVWEHVLTMSQVMETPLDDATKQKIEKFRNLLQVKTKKKNLVDDSETEVAEPGPLAVAYEEKRAAYDNAALDYNSHRIDALSASTPEAVHYWAMNANILRDKVRAAMSDWISNGYKNDYEQIAAYLDQVQARDLTLLKAHYKDDLEKAKLTGLASGSDFYFSSVVPGNFARSAGWTKFGFSSGDFASNSSSNWSTSRWSANAGGGFLGIFGGSGSHSESRSSEEYHGTFHSDFFNLSFEICQVPIVRPWFKPAFVIGHTWRFDQNNPDTKSEAVSDGGTPPKGLVPAYPTSMVVIRNLSLGLGQSDSFSNFMSSRQSSSSGGGGFVSFGPFFLGGSASNFSAGGRTDRNWGYSWNNQTMSVSGMQIIGFKCHVFPKSPDPNPTIKTWV
jgi:hypothetical protein